MFALITEYGVWICQYFCSEGVYYVLLESAQWQRNKGMEDLHIKSVILEQTETFLIKNSISLSNTYFWDLSKGTCVPDLSPLR